MVPASASTDDLPFRARPVDDLCKKEEQMTRMSGPPLRDIGSEISRWLPLATIVFCATEE